MSKILPILITFILLNTGESLAFVCDTQTARIITTTLKDSSGTITGYQEQCISNNDLDPITKQWLLASIQSMDITLMIGAGTYPVLIAVGLLRRLVIGRG